MDKKIKVLMISDHIFSTSGVGHQARLVAEALLDSGKFQVRNLGGAIRHENYNPVKIDKYGDDLIIFPVDSFGSPEIIRSILRTERPDIVWLMADPRFLIWLLHMEDEIRPLCPMIWYNIWDNFPIPKYNKPYYESVDYLVPISRLTANINKVLVSEKTLQQIPHSVNPNIFTVIPDEFVKQFRKDTLKSNGKYLGDDKIIFFYNGRNARRKCTGSMIWWFNSFLEIVGKDKAVLLMHTDPRDDNGPNLELIVQELGLTNGEVLFSREKISQEGLALIYNMVDCTINLSSAEGFGIPVEESLFCGTPVIAPITGGIQEQVTDGKDNWFGVGIEPVSKMIIGSQDIPYIREDTYAEKDFVDALLKIFNMTRQERKILGKKGKEYITEYCNFDKFNEQWVDVMFKIYEENGSWETRKNYSSWTMIKL